MQLISLLSIISQFCQMGEKNEDQFIHEGTFFSTNLYEKRKQDFKVPADGPGVVVVAMILIDIINGYCCRAEFDPGVSC